MNVLRKLLFAGLVLIGVVVSSAPAQGATNLVRAAESFAVGKTYKLSPTAADREAGRYDCTTFVEELLKQAGFRTGGDIGRRINIVMTGPDTARLKQLVVAKDAKIKGVVEALVSSGQGGEVTGMSSLQPGDVLQLWRIQDERPGGHTGIVKSVDATRKEVVLVGAHTSGVGAKKFVLDASVMGWPTWFAVRPKL